MASMSAPNISTLRSRLAEALSINSRYNIHHLSSPPTQCPALYSAPPGEDPEKTFCESHFLSVAIEWEKGQLQVFALEVLIYTTEYLTTLFVSKADSTGYIHHLNLPKSTPSPFKKISTTFLAFLIETRQCPDRKLVLSLFARAQDQYLFPGSIENPRKHVLDDRGLIKWWCQVVDPILFMYPSPDEIEKQESRFSHGIDSCTSRGYLRVPGCDVHETRGFFPRQLRNNLSLPRKWLPADPLRDLGRSPLLPERCLIPRFPDDPKARYVDELDEELPEPVSQMQKSPFKGPRSGQWKSVRSLEQFWEMMAFRQECSSGRLVGFLWGVFTPVRAFVGCGEVKGFNDRFASSGHQNNLELPALRHTQAQDVRDSENEMLMNTIQEFGYSFTSSPDSPTQRPNLSAKPAKAVSLKLKAAQRQPSTGPITSHEPRRAKAQPEKTRWYYWPTSARGEVVLREKDYQRVNNLLIRLDYADEETAAKSTKRWIDDVAVIGRVEKWGHTVVGRNLIPEFPVDVYRSSVATLDTGLVRKKKRATHDGHEEVEQAIMNGREPGVNVLSIGLVRKKPKILKDSGKFG